MFFFWIFKCGIRRLLIFVVDPATITTVSVHRDATRYLGFGGVLHKVE